MGDENPKQPEQPAGVPNPTRDHLIVDPKRPVFGNGKRKHRALGGSIRQFWNFMGHKTQDELDRIAKDPKTPQAKRLAAVYMLRAAIPDKIGAAIIFKMVEHTDGRPVQRVDVTVHQDQATQFIEGVFTELQQEAELALQNPRKLVGEARLEDTGGGK